MKIMKWGGGDLAFERSVDEARNPRPVRPLTLYFLILVILSRMTSWNLNRLCSELIEISMLKKILVKTVNLCLLFFFYTSNSVSSILYMIPLSKIFRYLVFIWHVIFKIFIRYIYKIFSLYLTCFNPKLIHKHPKFQSRRKTRWTILPDHHCLSLNWCGFWQDILSTPFTLVHLGTSMICI